MKQLMEVIEIITLARYSWGYVTDESGRSR
jgi:hypothetical protein